MNALGFAALVAVISAALTTLLGIAATRSGPWFARRPIASRTRRTGRRTDSAAAALAGPEVRRDCPLRGSGRCGSDQLYVQRSGSTTSVPPNRSAHERCAQAVQRTANAVDTLSTTTARQALRTVVRRMEAELPNVRALVELERSLRADPVDASAVERVRHQLDEASERFHLLAEHIMGVVVCYVATPDVDQLHREVVALRGQFPLLRPMSDVLGQPVPAEVPA